MDPMNLKVQVLLDVPGGRRRAIQQGEALHSGDHIVVSARVDQAAHVTVLSRGGGGSVPLTAGDEGRFVEAGTPLEIGLRLDDRIGDEIIQVIAATGPRPREIPPITTGQRDRGDFATAQADATGVAVACFRFRHAAPVTTGRSRRRH